MFKQIRKCSIETMNDILKNLKKYHRIFLFRAPEKDEEIGRFKVFLYKKITTAVLIYKDLKNSGKVIQYTTKLDGSFNGVEINGANAFSYLQKYYKAPETNGKDDAPFSIGISPYRNPKFVGKRVENCYGYDLNSAYPWGMLQDLPDTNKPLKPGKVGKNEYSFTETGLRAKIGTYSKYRFELMKSPYTRFVDRWYAAKKNAKNDAEKNTAKFVLNASIGALQNHNAFLRAAIIDNFHTIITELSSKYKDHILSTNVDSIVSDIRIPEIEANIGSNIGQWKLEHTGSFAIHKNAFSVQWNFDIPSFGGGKSKTWFKEGYDILTDPLPEPNNLYYINTEKCIIARKVK